MALDERDPAQTRYNTKWRKMASTIYARPLDGKVSGFAEIDFRPAQKAIEQWNEAGHRVTPLHLTMAIMAQVLGRHVPEMNCYARWGGVQHRGDVVISAAISIKGKDLTTFLVHNADKKTVLEVADEVNAGVQKMRDGTKVSAKKKSSGGLAWVPWPFRRWLYNLIRWVTYELGVSIPGTGFNRNMFGSVLVTNIGPLGLDNGFPAIMPASNLPFVIGVGRVQEKAMVENGEVVAMPIIPFTGTFDHRVLDGSHVGRFATALRHYLAHPEELAEPR